jgi:hypothetical protein
MNCACIQFQFGDSAATCAPAGVRRSGELRCLATSQFKWSARRALGVLARQRTPKDCRGGPVGLAGAGPA